MGDNRKSASARARLIEILGWFALAAFLIVAVPLFLRMGVTNDVTYYDICTRHVLQGGALERDILFLVPPGMVWTLALVRSIGGWSSEAVRFADITIVTAIVWLLVYWLRATGVSRAGRVWTALLLFAFYLSTTEWVHCQPDTWMLLPALAALHLRRRQIAAYGNTNGSARSIGTRAVLEGLCWGAGCLIKPYVAIPGLLTWLMSVMLVRRSGPGWLRRVTWDTGGLLAGGLVMGLAWQVWLLQSGSWAAFWHNNADFRGDFYGRTAPVYLRGLALLLLMWPWNLLHLFALPLAVGTIVIARLSPDSLLRPRLAAESLFAAFYLGWVMEVTLIQSQLDYQLVPAILLAPVLLSGWLNRRIVSQRSRISVAVFTTLTGFVALIIVLGPAFRPERLALWGRCCREASSADLKDQVSLYKHQFLGHTTTWTELEQVSNYLRSQGVADGDVLCFDATTGRLQLQLGLSQPTRYIYASVYLTCFVQHRETIYKELMAGAKRYIVTDSLDPNRYDTKPGAAPIARWVIMSTEYPPNYPDWWPYSEPVVFSSGRYQVHEVSSRMPVQN